MSNFKDIINLAKADGGKFFVVDEEGKAKLVILSVEEYQKLLLGKLRQQVMDVESINQKITQAQLEDVPEIDIHHAVPKAPRVPRAKTLQEDLRAEVIDPSFDFEGPKVGLDDL